MKMDKIYFGKLPSGQKIYKYTLQTDNNMFVEIINYGCTITAIKTPDRSRELVDVVLGFNTLEEYLNSPFYFGALIGPVAGRISSASYNIAEKRYELEKNENGITHLHGAEEGLDKVVWNAEEIIEKSVVGLKFTYCHEDTGKGYPGRVEYKVKYILSNDNKLSLLYDAETTEPTSVNLTNHSYFNLNGENSGKNVLNQKIKINSEYFLPLDKNSIPTGEIMGVKDTPFNFTDYVKFGDVVDSDYSQVKQAGGFDHPLLLGFEYDNLPQVSAYNPDNGIKMEVFTDQPSLVLFTSNCMDSSFAGKSGVAYPKHCAFCLETQGIPDAVNNRHFQSVIIDEYHPYKQRTAWKFTVE